MSLGMTFGLPMNNLNSGCFCCVVQVTHCCMCLVIGCDMFVKYVCVQVTHCCMCLVIGCDILSSMCVVHC